MRNSEKKGRHPKASRREVGNAHLASRHPGNPPASDRQVEVEETLAVIHTEQPAGGGSKRRTLANLFF